jgi:hypothetical protein
VYKPSLWSLTLSISPPKIPSPGFLIFFNIIFKKKKFLGSLNQTSNWPCLVGKVVLVQKFSNKLATSWVWLILRFLRDQSPRRELALQGNGIPILWVWDFILKKSVFSIISHLPDYHKIQFKMCYHLPSWYVFSDY